MMNLLKRGLIIQGALLVVLVAAALTFGGVQQAVSAVLGSVIFLVSLGAMIWSIFSIIQKKFIALAGLVIVLKYLFLALVLYWMASQPWISFLWVALESGSVAISAAVLTLAAREKI